MILKTMTLIPAVLLALASGPALALDISLGGSAGGDASGSVGNSGASVGVDASAAASASTSADDGGDETTGSVSGSASASGSANASGSGSVSVSTSEDDPLLEVIDLIQASAWTNASFTSMATIDGTTYDIGAWVDSENQASLEAVLADNLDEIAQLQAAIEANASFSALLDAENADVSSVVAVGVAADGSLAVFTYD